MSPYSAPGPTNVADEPTLRERLDYWRQLAAPIPQSDIAWRQDGKVVVSNGRFLARFVAYIDAGTVFQRLEDVVPGEWDLTLELLPTTVPDENGETLVAFKARLQVLGVIREDVGLGRDYKSAATDAFKRAAVRFGIANELYRYGVNWVQVDRDSKYAKPLEDPAAAYARHGRRQLAAVTPTAGPRPVPRTVEGSVGQAEPPAVASAVRSAPSSVRCPKCGGEMWDNRRSKRNPAAPDYRCKTKTCEGVIWPPRPKDPEDYPDERPNDDDFQADPNVVDRIMNDNTDDLPF